MQTKAYKGVSQCFSFISKKIKDNIFVSTTLGIQQYCIMVLKYHPWRKYRIEFHSESIRTIPIHSDIGMRANANHSQPI